MTPLLFVDTECDGVHYHRRVWEVAMIRRDDQGERETSFFVRIDLANSDPFGLNIGRFWDRHPAGRKMSGKPPSPADSAPVYNCHDAARVVMEWTFGAHLVGAVPNFDAEVLARLLRAEGYLPSWHYHLVDVEAMAAGFLGVQPPWNSDELSRRCGVEPPIDVDRHTALGDARWALRWYDKVAGVAS